MTDIEIIALIEGAARIITAVVNHYTKTTTARIAAEAAKPNSQVGIVGEKEVRNQVSPLPPKEN